MSAEVERAYYKRMVTAEAKAEALEAVLRSLISCGGTSPTIKAMAMNTLEPGSGDAWLAKVQP